MSDYWYHHRDELREGDEFITESGSRVILDRRVPGDGTQWYVGEFWNGSYAFQDSNIEPGDLRERVPVAGDKNEKGGG